MDVTQAQGIAERRLSDRGTYLLQQLADDAFDRFRQAAFALAAAGLAASQVRYDPRALPGSADQESALDLSRKTRNLHRDNL